MPKSITLVACWADTQAERVFQRGKRVGYFTRQPRYRWLAGENWFWWLASMALPTLIVFLIGQPLGLWWPVASSPQTRSPAAQRAPIIVSSPRIEARTGAFAG